MPYKKKKSVKKKKKKTVSKSFHDTHVKAATGTHRKVATASSARISHLLRARRAKTKSNANGCETSKIIRIFSPFNKFPKLIPMKPGKSDVIPYKSPNPPTGLSPKERAYVISSCQSRSTRYQKLKALAASAMKNNKIFSIYGGCNAVRKALLDRGWVEKLPLRRMNLAKVRTNEKLSNKSELHGELERLLLSNLVEKCQPNFIWQSKEDGREALIDMSRDCNTIVNKLKIDALWTSKQGLCSSMKTNYWFYIEDVSDVISPRTYSSFDSGEIEDFVSDYKLTACTSLLKWVLSMTANDRPIFLETGKISLNVIVFALNRCKEYLFHKQNKDIDKSIGTVSNNQWNAFLKKYYRIISKEDVFQEDKEKKLPIFLGFSKFLLKEIHRYRPQLSCEGAHNIWILKPAQCSRGRGIRMASKLGVITNMIHGSNAKYVIQKYIEEPLLIHETKFDIRQYYLVTSTYPLVIWMYKDCYLKFSSQKYNLRNFHESIHLTNNAVQRKYKNCEGRHEELPQHNMWHLDTYKDYLNKIGKDKVWDNLIYPGMIKSIIGIMLSCQDSLSVSRNRFELYGCDFILDKEYKPWLIEINSCPDLNHTTQVTARICPEVISDIIKVVIDRAARPNASTGKFQCVYRQPITVPRYGAASDLVVRGYALPPEYFYRGNIQLNELYDDADIDKERDIKAILNKLKQRYDTDIMKEPEDDTYCQYLKNKETLPSTKSDNDLNEAATIITKQLDELFDRMTEKTSSTKSPVGRHASFWSIEVEDETCKKKNLHSMLDTKSIMRISSSESSKPEYQKLNVRKSFVFSKLDDGCSIGKGSFFDINRFEKEFSYPRIKIKKSVSETNPMTQDSILKAARKVISFLNKKEVEYKSDCN